MKILAIEKETPGAALTEYQPHLRDEAAHVYQLYQAGVIRETYFHQQHHTAVLLLECADAAAAQLVLDTFPLVRAGLITFEVLPLVPYTGLARLFEQTDEAALPGKALRHE